MYLLYAQNELVSDQAMITAQAVSFPCRNEALSIGIIILLLIRVGQSLKSVSDTQKQKVQFNAGTENGSLMK